MTDPTPLAIRRDVTKRVRNALALVQQAYDLALEAAGELSVLTGEGACETYEQVRAAASPLYDQLKALHALQSVDAHQAWGLDEDGISALAGRASHAPSVPRSRH